MFYVHIPLSSAWELCESVQFPSHFTRKEVEAQEGLGNLPKVTPLAARDGRNWKANPSTCPRAPWWPPLTLT